MRHCVLRHKLGDQTKVPLKMDMATFVLVMNEAEQLDKK